jgi:hypothetical protein
VCLLSINNISIVLRLRTYVRDFIFRMAWHAYRLYYEEKGSAINNPPSFISGRGAWISMRWYDSWSNALLLIYVEREYFLSISIHFGHGYYSEVVFIWPTSLAVYYYYTAAIAAAGRSIQLCENPEREQVLPPKYPQKKGPLHRLMYSNMISRNWHM